jgi:hypothetical protein
MGYASRGTTAPEAGAFDHLGVFLPNAERARGLAGRVRLGVAESLAALCDRLAEHLSFDRDGLHGIARAIRNADRVRPEVFALYHSLLDKIAARDRSHIEAVISRLLAVEVNAAPIACLHLDQAVLGEPLTALYVGNVSDETDISFRLVPVSRAEFDDAAASIDRDLRVIAEVAPECAHECFELITELLITSHDRAAAPFGGASSFQQWGAVVADVSGLVPITRLVPTLLHETTHLLLFAMAMDEPLLSAAPGRRFASPLRDELRTMDGVYHATIVCARMHYGLGRLLDSGRLAGAERTMVLKTMRYQHERFQSGARTIRDNADLSSTAGRMLREAETYLATHREAA